LGASLLVIRDPAKTSAVIAGLLDISVSASYLLDVSVTTWYAIALVIKLVLVTLLRAPGRAGVFFHLPALSAMAMLLAMSCWLGGAEAGTWIAAVGFIAHLVATMAAVRPDKARSYLASVAYAGLAVAVVYDLLAILGRIEVVYGRYFFFGGSQPNLGGEILAMTTVAACMSLGLRRFLLVALPALIAVGLMQGRAALLVMLFAIAIRLCMWVVKQRRLVIIVVLCVGALGLAALLSEPVRNWLATTAGTVFLVDDPNRGFGTGFVGRSDRWQAAWDAFIEKPLFGQGFGYYESTGVESAHNFYMYALVEFGLLSLPIFFYAIWCMRRMAHVSPKIFVCFLPILVLTMFNDRFINLNPYPFVMIAIVLLVGTGVAFRRN
jgi:O-antigen ligase